MPQISVIVPVYNSGDFLHRCVDSILAQTFPDFELFLVDDGSKDNSPEICDAYALQDPRVRVIHQPNQGQSVARNNAIAQMCGEWVMFCDSDDWIHPESLELLYNAAMEYGTGVSVGGYQETTGENPEVRPEQLNVELWSPKDFYIQSYVHATLPVMKLIRRDCLGDLRFPVGKYIDDEYIVYRILFTQEKLAVIPAPFYAYFVNVDSLTKRPWNPGRLDAWQAFEEQIVFFEALGDKDLIYRRYREYLDNALANYDSAKKTEQTEEILRVRRYMKKHIRSLICRMWKRNHIIFWLDHDTLMEFCPIQTRIYRFFFEMKK